MDTEAIEAMRAVSEMVRAIRATGANVSKTLILIELYGAGAGGWQLGPLADLLHQDKTTVRRWLRELIRRGYAERCGNRYRLTAAGRARIERRAEACLEACQPETRQAIYRIMRPRRR